MESVWNWSDPPCRLIDYPLTKQYRQTHFDVSEIISEKVFSMTLLTNTRAAAFKSASSQDKRGVLFGENSFFSIHGAITRKNICVSFLVALSG